MVTVVGVEGNALGLEAGGAPRNEGIGSERGLDDAPRMGQDKSRAAGASKGIRIGDGVAEKLDGVSGAIFCCVKRDLVCAYGCG